MNYTAQRQVNCEKVETQINNFYANVQDISQKNPFQNQSCEIRRNMKSEGDRFLTYVDWPNNYIAPKELARAGFYSMCYEDAVRCTFCGVEICRWVEGDNAMAEHQRWSNSCPFVRGQDVGNIPLEPNEANLEYQNPSRPKAITIKNMITITDSSADTVEGSKSDERSRNSSGEDNKSSENRRRCPRCRWRYGRCDAPGDSSGHGGFQKPRRPWYLLAQGVNWVTPKLQWIIIMFFI